MKNPDKSTPQEKVSLDDSVRLKIREEVEQAVEKRAKNHETLLEQRERYYTIIISIIGAFFSTIAIIMAGFFGYRAIEMPRLIESKFTDTGVSNAITAVLNVETNALLKQQALNQLVDSAMEKQQAFTNRLNEIKQQDNVVLAEDLSKLFVVQIVTNLVDGNKIVLNYEPIPHTVRVVAFKAKDNELLLHAQVKGNIIFLEAGAPWVRIPTQAEPIELAYVKKSLR